VFFQYGGDVSALLSGGAGEVVFFEDFVQADAGGRSAGKVEDVARGVVRVGKRQKAAGGQFGRVERGLQPVVVIGLGRAVAEVAGEAGEAGVADEAETARRINGGAVFGAAAAAGDAAARAAPTTTASRVRGIRIFQMMMEATVLFRPLSPVRISSRVRPRVPTARLTRISAASSARQMSTTTPTWGLKAILPTPTSFPTGWFLIKAA